MKKARLLILSIVLALFTSCYDDSELRSTLQDHERRIAAVEQLCKEMNTNIASLQSMVTALQNNDYVTGVSPVMQGKEILGYTISFSKSGPITIYHGIDGKDSANGDGGSTPVIGVALSEDGIYYWTLDGSWLLDGNGNKIPATGKDGKDGKDGITPQLKIENGYWYVSYNNGATWTKLGKATGENGNDGQNGTDGSGIFKDFSQDENNVYLTLNDGTVITLPKNPKLFINLNIDPTDISISAGESIDISYELLNASSNPVVTASSDGNFIIKQNRQSPTAGYITIKTTLQSEDGFVNIIATDDTGRSSIIVINVKILYNTMIFKVSAIAENSYLASLPLHGELDCTVDWGDGTVQQIKGVYNGGAWPSPHQYALMEADYTVKINGKVTWLCSNYCDYDFDFEDDGDPFDDETPIPYHSVKEVIQWGNTELTSMRRAFYGNKLLSSIPSDETGSFSDVTSFSLAFCFCEALSGRLPENLFANCTNVTSFYGTFGACAGLRGSIPENLFANCTNVTSFYGTFIVCDGLTGSIPENLFANCPKVTDFSHTFVDCTGLTGSIPENLFANCTKVISFYDTFYGCSGLTGSIPENLFTNCTKVTDFSGTFLDCEGLTGSIPENLFSNCPNVTDFSGTFDGCSGLTSIPAGLFNNCLKVTDFNSTFGCCSGLTCIPAGLFDNCSKVTSFNATFGACTGLTSIPEKVFANCPNVTSFSYTFSDCSGLTSIPAGLFNNCLKVTDFFFTFYGCTGLTGESPYSVINGEKVHLYERENYPDYFVKPTSYSGCFDECTNLSDYSIIPWDWK